MMRNANWWKSRSALQLPGRNVSPLTEKSVNRCPDQQSNAKMYRGKFARTFYERFASQVRSECATRCPGRLSLRSARMWPAESALRLNGRWRDKSALPPPDKFAGQCQGKSAQINRLKPVRLCRSGLVSACLRRSANRFSGRCVKGIRQSSRAVPVFRWFCLKGAPRSSGLGARSKSNASKFLVNNAKRFPGKSARNGKHSRIAPAKPFAKCPMNARFVVDCKHLNHFQEFTAQHVNKL